MGIKNRKYIFFLIIFFFNISLLEIFSYTFGYFFLSRQGVMYVSDPPSEDSFRRYLDKRDPVLGWPPPSRYGQEDLDQLGARINTFFPNTASQACVSTYGDSFTFGNEVDNVAAFPNQLSRILGCRVNNFGVSGYGTDQALIRFRVNESDSPRVAVLAHLSEDIIRNVTQFSGFIYGSRFGFKPRFVPAIGSTFELRPILNFDGLNYKDVYKNPSNYFHDDYFLPDGPGKVPFLRFPYTLAAVKSLFSYKFRGFFDYRDAYTEPFYEVGHASNALEVTQFIIQEFRREAIRRDIVPLVVIVPIVVDLLAKQSTGSWPYRNLVENLEKKGDVALVDFGEVLIKHMERTGKSVCDFYRKEWHAKGGCTGHFNEDGNLLLAKAITTKIKSIEGPKLGIFQNK
jgi:hypothetical protein